MVFSSSVFLFAFLPIVILTYYLLKDSLRNYWLLLASLVFYAWNKPDFLWILLASICLNYAGAYLIFILERKIGYENQQSPIYNDGIKKAALISVVALNLLILFYFKYFNFTILILNKIIQTGITGEVILPIGISFFTFQGLSYVIDVYRGDVPAQKNIFKLAMYISMFPQLVAGPIVRYQDIYSQVDARRVRLDDFTAGISRFIIGLFRKVVIADTLAVAADTIFSMQDVNRSAEVAWLGLTAYTLQIYFDFSGYSDMAIGMGRMLGFHFMENFNYPYISKSITEFWRRWHISLLLISQGVHR